MNREIKNLIIKVCDEKIARRGISVGLSFYAFFKSNKNTNPELLLEIAKWWISIQKFNHFEKAQKIKNIVLDLE